MASVDTTKVLSDFDLDSIMDDWFERDGETFTKKSTLDRLGWEKSLGEGEAYSAYLLEAPTQSDLIKRAYSLAKDMLVVMDPPFKIHLKISPKPDSYTDGKRVHVSTKVFDDESLSVGAKLDVFLGLTIHEGCHCLYTEFEKVVGEHLNRIESTLFNIIEDERIECICAEKKPGLANFLEANKYYCFDQYYLDVIEETESSMTPFERLMNLFLHIIRYPKYLRETECLEFGHYLLEAKKILVPFPATTIETCMAAKKIFAIFKDFYIEKEREEEVKRMSGESGESGADTGTSTSGEGVESTEMTESTDATEGTAEGDTEKSKSPTPRTDAKIKEDALRKLEEDSKSAHKLDKLIETHSSIRPGDMAFEVSKSDGLLGEVCEGTVECGHDAGVYFKRVENNEIKYKQSYERVKRYIPSIARILKGHCREYQIAHHSMRSGILDTNKLAEAVQGVPTVYMRKGEVKSDKVSLCVLIDESGSMMREGRVQAAKDAAVLINEAFKTTPNIELFIYGHSGDIRHSGSTELYIYRENGYAPKYALGNVSARDNNRDGVAIVEAARRVRSQTKNPVLMFILSDGEPAAREYVGKEAIKHVKECVEKVEKMNFDVVQICINACYDPATMFKHFVVLEDMSTLATELGKTIKKATMQKVKSHVL